MAAGPDGLWIDLSATLLGDAITRRGTLSLVALSLPCFVPFVDIIFCHVLTGDTVIGGSTVYDVLGFCGAITGRNTL